MHALLKLLVAAMLASLLVAPTAASAAVPYNPDTLCQKTFPLRSGDDPENQGFLGWETVFGLDHPTEWAPDPSGYSFVFTGCFWQRYIERGERAAAEKRPALQAYAADKGEVLLLMGADLWEFAAPAWTDSRSIVFIYWRGYDAWTSNDSSLARAPSIRRESGEGIYHWVLDGTSRTRQLLTLYNGELAQSQNVVRPRPGPAGNILFEFEDAINPSRDGTYSLPLSCNACTMADAKRAMPTDTGGFHLTLKAAPSRMRIASLLRRGYRLRGTVSTAGAMGAELKLSASQAARLGLARKSTVIAQLVSRSDTKSHSITLRVKPAYRKAVRRARRFKAKLNIVGMDAARNTDSISRTVTFTR